MRLFFALWPDTAVRERLAAVSEGLPRRCGRRIPADNLHITLSFLGNVAEDSLDCLLQGAAEIRNPAFELVLAKLGWFRRARVVWLAPDGDQVPPALIDLAGAVNRVVRRCGLEPDGRAYRPHLTLTRKAARPPGRAEPEPIRWNVNDFCLVESVTRDTGPEYRILRRWVLTSD